MVMIRLSRAGAKKRAFYHIVVTDRRNARDAGTHIERVGFYNPCASGQEVRLTLDRSRIEHWLGKGAKASDRVQQLIKNAAA
jgi:small subunit ribosomal protein S16